MNTTLTKTAAVLGAIALVAVYVLLQSGKRWFEEVAPPLPPKPAAPSRIAGGAPADLTPPLDPSAGPVFAAPISKSQTTATPGKASAPGAATAEMPPIELPVQVAPQSKPLDPKLLPATSNAPNNIVAPNPLAPLGGASPAGGPAGPLGATPPLTLPAQTTPGPASPTLPQASPYNAPKIQSGPLTISTQATPSVGLALPQIGPNAHSSAQASPLIKTQTVVMPGTTQPTPQPTGPQIQFNTGGPRIGTQSPILPGNPAAPPSPLGPPK